MRNMLIIVTLILTQFPAASVQKESRYRNMPIFQAGHFSGVTQILVAPDGRSIASAGADGIRIWDSRRLTLRQFLTPQMLGWPPAEKMLESVGREPLRAFDGKRVCQRTTDTYLEWRSATNGKLLERFHGAVISADGEYLYFRKDTKLRVFHWPTRRWRDLHADMTLDSDIYFDAGWHYISVQDGGKMQLWQITRKNKTGLYHAYKKHVLRDDRGDWAEDMGVVGPVSFSPDGRYIVTSGEHPDHQDIFHEQGPQDGTVNSHNFALKLWSIKTGKLIHTWLSNSKDEGPQLLKFTKDSRFVICAGDSPASLYDSNIDLWNVKTSKMRPLFKDEVPVQHPYALFPDDQRVACAIATHKFQQTTFDWQPCIFSLQQRKILAVAPPSLDYVHHLTFSPDSRYLIQNGSHNGLRVWELQTGAIKQVKELPDMGAAGFASNELFWAHTGSHLQCWSIERGRLLKKTPIPSPLVSDLKLASIFPDGNFVGPSPDGRYILISSKTGDSLNIWDSQNRKSRILKCVPAISDVSRLRVSPDNTRIASLPYSNGALNIWSLQTGKLIRRFEGNGESVISSDWTVAFKNNEFWSIKTGSRLGSWPDNSTSVIAISPRGEYVACENVANHSGGIQVFRRKDRKLLFAVPVNLYEAMSVGTDITSATFSPDGQSVAIAAGSKLELWRLITGKKSATFYAVSGGRFPGRRGSYMVTKGRKNIVSYPSITFHR